MKTEQSTIDHRVIRAASAVGVVAALGYVAVRVALLGEDPVTRRYQDLNRVWLIALALVPFAVAAVYVGGSACPRPARPCRSRGRVAGSVSRRGRQRDRVQQGNGRAFLLFGLGVVVFAAGMVVLGTSLRRLDALLAAASAALAVTGLFGFLSSIAGPIGIIASVAFVLAWGVAAARARPRTPDRASP